MILESVLNFAAAGAWNGGTPISNAPFEKRGMFFKRGIPVTDHTIQERIGVRSRMAASSGERIGPVALKNLIQENSIIK